VAIPSGIVPNPHPEGWGYTDKARLRGLLYKISLFNMFKIKKAAFT
jgi:hypothetical protein